MKTERAPRSSALPTFRADIDGLRAIAVLLVLVFHFDLVGGARAGFVGVDVFFVISGFLITSILQRQLQAGTLTLRAFYLARVRRLAPALVATLVLVLAAGWVMLFPQDLEDLGRQVLVSQFYVANIYYWRSINYFGLGTDNVFLLHLWSLAVEEQFYLVYPLALVLIHRWRPRFLWAAIGLALVASFALNVAFVARKPEATFYLLPTRAWELLAGALIPWFTSRWPRPAGVDGALGVVGLVLVAAAVICYGPGVRFPGFYALLPVAGAFFLLLSGARAETPAARLLALSPLTYIGRISYPLYLVHWPINVFAARALGDHYASADRCAFFGASIALAALMYHAVENPIRRGPAFSRASAMLALYGAGLFVTLACVGAIEATSGLPGRYPIEVARLAGYVNDRSPPLRECEFTGQRLSTVADFCAIGAPGGAPRWMVYGDSHAWATHAAFDQWLKAKGVSGLFAYRSACPPLIDVHVFGDRGGCHGFNGAVMAFLGVHPEVAGVVLVSSWYEAPEGILTAEAGVRPTSQSSLALFDARFSTTLERLRALGKTVYVWEPVPGARGNVPAALARAHQDGTEAQLSISLEQYRRNAAFFLAAADKNAGLIAVRISPSEALCKSGFCAVTIGDVPAYFDNSHLTASTAGFWSAAIARAERSPGRAGVP